MSQDTPSKGRIERHLMRQRGAGVRTVTADFGFSFAPSFPSIAPTTPSQEPPTKRRKTALENEVIVAPIAVHQAQDITPPLPSAQAVPAARTEIQEEVCQDARTPVASKVSTNALEPAFSGSTIAQHVEEKSQEVLQKRGRVAKIGAKKRVPQPVRENVENVDDSFVQSLKTRKKPVRKKKEIANVEEVVEEVPEPPAAITKKPARKKNAATVAEEVVQEVLEAPPATIKKHAKKTEPSPIVKGLIAGILQDEPEPPPATTKKPARKRKLPVSPDPAPVPSRGRPKRQAAVSATEKVTMGFEVEDVPIDKMRREAEPPQAAPSTRKKRAAPARAPPSPPATEPSAPPALSHEDKLVAEALTEPVRTKAGRVRKTTGPKRTRAASPVGTPLLNGAESPTAEPSLPEAVEDKQPAAKKRAIGRNRKATVFVESPVDELSVESDGPPKKRGRKTSARKPAVQAPTTPMANADDEVRRLSRIEEEAPTLESAPDDIRTDAAPASNASSKPPTTATQDPRSSQARAAPARKPLGEADANIVRKSLSPEKLAIQRPSIDKVAIETRTQPSPAKRRKRFQDLSPEKPVVKKRKQASLTSALSPNPSKPAEYTTSSTEGKEAKDMDWLFAEPAKRNAVKPASRRGKEKRAPFRFADRSCKDMDLDDLLESVAAFSSGTTKPGRGKGTVV